MRSYPCLSNRRRFAAELLDYTLSSAVSGSPRAGGSSEILTAVHSFLKSETASSSLKSNYEYSESLGLIRVAAELIRQSVAIRALRHHTVTLQPLLPGSFSEMRALMVGEDVDAASAEADPLCRAMW